MLAATVQSDRIALLAATVQSDRIALERYPDITWEHSHVVVDDGGAIRTYCVYEAPSEESRTAALLRAACVDLEAQSERHPPRLEPQRGVLS